MILFITHRTWSGLCWPLWPCLPQASFSCPLCFRYISHIFVSWAGLVFPPLKPLLFSLPGTIFSLSSHHSNISSSVIFLAVIIMTASAKESHPLRILGHTLFISCFNYLKLEGYVCLCPLPRIWPPWRWGIIFLAQWWASSTENNSQRWLIYVC